MGKSVSVESEKESRTRAIFRLIKRQAIGTQAELVEALNSAGYEVTQATASRDVRRLGLVKVPLAGGGYRYAAPSEATMPVMNDKRFNLKSFVTGVTAAEAFCVVETLPGRAMTIAVTIDEMQLSSVLGTLAGDDLVLVMIDKSEERDAVRATLTQLFEERI